MYEGINERDEREREMKREIERVWKKEYDTKQDKEVWWIPGCVTFLVVWLNEPQNWDVCLE